MSSSKRSRRPGSAPPALRRSKRKKGNSTHAEPDVPSYQRHRLGEDNTFYSPNDSRPSPPPPGATRHAGPSVSSETAALLKPYKDILTEASQAILYSLAPLSRDSLRTYEQLEWLTTSEAFSPVMLSHLRNLKHKNVNSGRSAQAGRVANLITLLTNSEEAESFTFSHTLSHLQVAASRSKLGHVDAILSVAFKRRAELKNIRSAGAACRKSATWLGVEKLSDDEISALKGKSLVESDAHRDLGIRSGALEPTADGKETFAVLENRGFHRICAPHEGQTKRATAVIVWEKATPEDMNPTPEKIVGAIVYSPELISKAFSPTQEYNNAEIRVTQDLLVEKENIDRPRLIDDGKMAKGVGPQSSHGIPYFMQIPDNPKDLNGNIKFPIRSLEPFLLGRHEAFLSGLLLEFAARRKTAAREANLINRLGFPSLSTFATYGYSASAHFDHDTCPSSGWVTSRSPSIDRYTSNFVWASHGVVAELAPNAFWFWRGKEDAHGTTVHLDYLHNRGKSYTKGHIKKNPDGAQWTRASVLTEAVSRAHQRHKAVP